MKRVILFASLLVLASCKKEEKEETLCNCGLLKMKMETDRVFILKNVCSENLKVIYNIPEAQYNSTPLGQAVCIDTLTTW
jgi:hypothetical protein